MTFKEFENNLYDEVLPNIDENTRIGQAVMIYLNEVWPEEYKRISSVHFYSNHNIDCFYNNRLVPNTLKHLELIWKNYPN